MQRGELSVNNKKHQVFISSTYTDLVEERKKVLDVLLMADCIPAGMEAFIATDVEQFQVIKKVIDLCDYYVLILGMRYGSINPDTGLSYTEMEYEYAKEKGIPTLVFAIDEGVDLDESKRETNREKSKKLKAFRNKVLSNRMACIWKSCEDLVGKVAVSIMRAKTEIFRPGWQRGTEYDEASLRKQIMDLTESNNELSCKLELAYQTIDEFMLADNLSFEDCIYEITYSYSERINSVSHNRRDSKSISLSDLFEVISLEMMDVMVTEKQIESVVKNLINKDKDGVKRIRFNDSQIIKRILNQLKQLKLIESHWSKENKILYWGLTQKGVRARDNIIAIKPC